MKKSIVSLMIAVCFGYILQSCSEKPTHKRLYENVIVIGIDGLTKDGLKQAETPVMDNLIANGAVKYDARTVLPSSSLSNWAAMMFGAGPEVTGITSNSWRPDGQRMQPVEKNQAGMFPNIFNVIREQLPQAEQGVMYEWGVIGYLQQKDVANRNDTYGSDDEVTRQACDYIISKKPTFLFIQLSEVDYGGHNLGFQSPEYLQTVANADSFVGRIMESIHKAGMQDNTLVMVVSDHGGIKTGHGGETVEETNVTYIYYGKGVKKNYTILQAVFAYDVAANVAFALGLKAPYAWTGRPTLAAFEGYEEPVSCRKASVIEDVIIEGELYAKNTIGVKFDTTLPEVTTSLQWFIANTPSGEWAPLQGIQTQEMVLLMDYADRYVKCEITAWKNDEKVATVEVISNEPVANRGNPNTDWFRDAGLGLMVHFLKGVYTSGGSEEWNEIVDGFDVDMFARQCKESGVNYVLWALGQNDGYYNAPNAAYDKITSVHAGDLCSRRDLPADLIRALKPAGIKLMFYLPGNPPISNEEVTKKFQYTYQKDSPTSQFTQACWESVIREWSLRYGKDLFGWWFDGMYRGGIIETRSDMRLKHNISTHTLAAKAGNRQSIVSYNYGVAEIQSDSPYDDYSAGEENHIIQLPGSRWILPGIQWFHFTHLGEFWARPGVKNKTADLETWSRKVFEKEGVLCFDVHVTAKGEIDRQQREQLRAIADIFQSVKNQ